MADRLLTKTVRQIIPESESYMELLEVEKKLDHVLMRKRLTLQESLKQPLKVIYIFIITIACSYCASNLILHLTIDQANSQGHVEQHL